MACLEKECRECHMVWANNRPKEPCPMCGSDRVSTYFDEWGDHHPHFIDPGAFEEEE